MTEETQLEHAIFKPVSGKGEQLTVHFNPVSLQLTVQNTLEEKGQGAEKKQYVTKSSAKLTMDLVFDTTHNGEDVRTYTQKLVQYMKPDKKHAPPVVSFEWGVYKFQGMVESYRETLDFFAPTGVPLRASVNMTLADQTKVFEPVATSRFDMPPTQPIQVPSSQGQDTTSLGTQGGDARAGRAIAASNNQESMRFTSGPLTIDASVSLRGPSAFASGGAGLSASLGAGVSGGLGGGVSIGGGIGLGGGISGGVSTGVSGGVGVSGGSGGVGMSGGAQFGVGASASAGVSATEGAFAGLRATSADRTPLGQLDPERLVQSSGVVQGATDPNATFRVGGQANIETPSSLRADVGATASLRSRIRFEE